MTDRAETVPLKPSDEGDETGLELGRAQGEAVSRTLQHMTDDIATDGREMRAGEYLVAYATEQAEGMYMPDGAGGLAWSYPQEENAHIEVAVRDPADGRFIPALEVKATLTGPDGQDLGTKTLPLVWHPYLYHYGINWAVPGSGTYRLRVRFDPPAFPRHDETNGRRFIEACDVTFDEVKIEVGQD